jgi:hypothetical protein
MALIKLSEYCCQGGERTIDTSRFTMDDLRLAIRDNRELIFSPLGNAPVAPRVALVGITPGGQSEAFARYLRLLSVPDAAKRAAFEGAQSQIKELLAAHGFAESIGLSLAADLNESPDIFTTSLVKCCLKVNGSYKYKAPEIAASPEAIHCVANRFLGDIGRFPSLEWIIIFGDPGWAAVTSLRVNGIPVFDRIKGMGVEVLNFPHFAQNFQQRAIFCLDESEEADYLKQKPKHAPYAHKAKRMRSALLAAMERRSSVP